MRPARRRDAVGYALALRRTTRRYQDGYMTRGTWYRHMTALWDIVEARGLHAAVCELLANASALVVLEGGKSGR